MEQQRSLLAAVSSKSDGAPRPRLPHNRAAYCWAAALLAAKRAPLVPAAQAPLKGCATKTISLKSGV